MYTVLHYSKFHKAYKEHPGSCEAQATLRGPIPTKPPNPSPFTALQKLLSLLEQTERQGALRWGLSRAWSTAGVVEYGDRRLVK